MKVNGLTVKQLEKVAKKLKLRITEVDETGVRVKWVKFRLRTDIDHKKYRKAYTTTKYDYSTKEWSQKTKTAGGAVCCHGNYDFIAAIFKVNPEARIQTSIPSLEGSNKIRYDGIEDFEEKADRDTDYYEEANPSPCLSYYQKEVTCNCDA